VRRWWRRLVCRMSSHDYSWASRYVASCDRCGATIRFPDDIPAKHRLLHLMYHRVGMLVKGKRP